MGGDQASKEPFNIDEAFHRLRAMTAGLPRAAMFDLRDLGYDTPFEILVGSLISARTRDETTKSVCLGLFRDLKTPRDFIKISKEELSSRLTGVGFREAKAADLVTLSGQLLERYEGQVPRSMEELTALRGVGPKIAALTRAVAFGIPSIAVDIHVHRVTNRWGYVTTSNPVQTMTALEAILPKKYWIGINERLVPFGKFQCTGARPRCSTCALLSMCEQVGVERPR